MLSARHEARLLTRDLYPSLGVHALNTALLKIQAISATGYFVSWMAFCVSFGAICFAVEHVRSGYEPSISDSFAAVRERLGPFLRLSVLLLSIFLGLEVVFMALILQGVLWLLESGFGHVSRFTVSALIYGLFALAFLIVSRFGLAIPALILDDCKIGGAMFRSDELSKGRWLVLAVLLFKSIVGGYVAGMIPFWLARLVPLGVHLPSWFQWVLAGASIAAVTVVEPIMFIGFALLYLKTSASSQVGEAQAVTA